MTIQYSKFALCAANHVSSGVLYQLSLYHSKDAKQEAQRVVGGCLECAAMHCCIGGFD